MSMLAPFTIARPRLSLPATTAYAAAAAITFAATAAAPTPLYRLYQEAFGLTAFEITLIFATYAVSIVASFLTLGRLSDHVGRRPMILAALLLNAAALLGFISATGVVSLIAARFVQGFGTGIALTTLGATIADTDPKNAPTLNGVTAFAGLTLGALIAGLLVSYAPMPRQLVYAVLLAASLAEIALLAVVPETTARRPGAWSVLVPRLSVPTAARAAMLRLTPLNVASWALGGFYLSLMPSLVAAATGTRSVLIGAAVVTALMLTGTIVVVALRQVAADRLVRLGAGGLGLGVAVTFASVQAQSAAGMFIGTVVAGVGFGAAYAGNLRTLLPLAGPDERARLLAAYFVASYTSFALPAVIAGLIAPRFGLVATSTGYGVVLVLLTLASIVAELWQGSRRPAEAPAVVPVVALAAETEEASCAAE
ncbi:MAG: MFS transporter [Ancalomicrobiaceae bacterium]|nr:MFS transporter [Ancalomicrobiaceae bacterium]